MKKFYLIVGLAMLGAFLHHSISQAKDEIMATIDEAAAQAQEALTEEIAQIAADTAAKVEEAVRLALQNKGFSQADVDAAAKAGADAAEAHAVEKFGELTTNIKGVVPDAAPDETQPSDQPII